MPLILAMQAVTVQPVLADWRAGTINASMTRAIKRRNNTSTSVKPDRDCEFISLIFFVLKRKEFAAQVSKNMHGTVAFLAGQWMPR
jgi:hypothetical protein